ncbi:MAG: BrnT family toxin [Gammaproteobacteria bacterium SHHR-1]
MKISFDPAKDAKNIAKHGVSLVLAKKLEWELMLCREDAPAA